jgi:hypothetical protein
VPPSHGGSRRFESCSAHHKHRRMKGFQGRLRRMPGAMLVSIPDDPGSQSGYRLWRISFLYPVVRRAPKPNGRKCPHGSVIFALFPVANGSVREDRSLSLNCHRTKNASRAKRQQSKRSSGLREDLCDGTLRVLQQRADRISDFRHCLSTSSRMLGRISGDLGAGIPHIVARIERSDAKS